ncbi:MAG: YdcF family protein [Bacteroidota bacterium]
MAILFILSFLLKSEKWKKRCRNWGFLCFFIFTNPLLSNLAMQLWELPPTSIGAISEPIDVAVVLGGYITPNSNIDQINFTQSVPRLTMPLQLYSRGKVDKLLLSGATGQIIGKKVNEAQLVGDFLVELGIPSGDIIQEDRSRNTAENAQFSAQIIRDSFPEARVAVITSGYHIRRARACFQKTGLDVLMLPTDSRTQGLSWRFDRTLIPTHQALEVWDKLIKEWVGMVYYWLRGWV